MTEDTPTVVMESPGYGDDNKELYKPMKEIHCPNSDCLGKTFFPYTEVRYLSATIECECRRCSTEFTIQIE